MALLDFLKKKQSIPQTPVKEQSKFKVLVVDDEVYLREFYQELLSRQGFVVITATNGQEALDKVTSDQPHLIILDIKMPVMDGNEVLRRLWENDLTKKIPVIVLTNAGDMSNMDKAKFYSSYQFFIKSNVSPEEVIKTVNEALNIFPQQV